MTEQHKNKNIKLLSTALTCLLLTGVFTPATAQAGIELYLDNLGPPQQTTAPAPTKLIPPDKTPAKKAEQKNSGSNHKAPTLPIEEKAVEALPAPEPLLPDEENEAVEPVKTEPQKKKEQKPKPSLFTDTPDTHNAVTLPQVLQNAYTNNPELKAARAEWRAVKEQLPQAAANWKPTLNANGSIESADIEGSNFGNADGSTAKDLYIKLNQPVFRGGRTKAQIKAARNTITEQSALLKQVEQNILLAATTAYMDVRRDSAIVLLNQNNIHVLEEQLQAAQNRFKVGEITRTDVSQAEARLAAAHSNLIRAQGALKSSHAIFEKTTGFPPPERLAEPSQLHILPATLEEAINISLEENPDVIAAIFAQKAAEDDVDQIFGELLPEVNAYASWNRTYDPQPGATPEQTTTLAGISASIPLYQGGAVRSRIRQAKEIANQNYLEILAAKNNAKESAITHWQTWQSAKAEIASRQAQVTAAATAQQGSHAELRVGTKSTLDALDADQEYLDAKVSLEEAKRDEKVAAHALAATLGLLTPVNIGFLNEKAETEAAMETVGYEVFSTNTP